MIIGIAIGFIAAIYLLFKFTRKRKPDESLRKELLKQKNQLKKTSAQQVFDDLEKSDDDEASTEQSENEAVTEAEAETEASAELPVKVAPEELVNFKLLTSEDLSENVTNEIIEMTKTIHRPHPMLKHLTGREISSAELVELVKSDLELTAKILRTVNSSAYALSKPITSISHAIIFLGVYQIKDITTHFVLKDILIANSQQQKDACNKLWIASYIASSTSFLLAQMMKSEQAAEISTQAMLSYIGDLAMVSAHPKLAENYLSENSSFHRVDHCQKELGVNAAIVGEILTSQWELPEQVVSGLKNSLKPMVIAPADYPYQDDGMKQAIICYLACRIGDLVAYGGVKDIAQIDFSQRDEAELFYLSEHLNKAGLNRLLEILEDAGFRKKVNLIISQAGH